MKGDFKLPSGKTFYPNDPSSADDEGDYLDFSLSMTLSSLAVLNLLKEVPIFCKYHYY